MGAVNEMSELTSSPKQSSKNVNKVEESLANF